MSENTETKLSPKKASLMAMVGPLTLVLFALVLIPMLYVVVISFLKRGEYGQLIYQFTFDNFLQMCSTTYLDVRSVI